MKKSTPISFAFFDNSEVSTSKCDKLKSLIQFKFLRKNAGLYLSVLLAFE